MRAKLFFWLSILFVFVLAGCTPKTASAPTLPPLPQNPSGQTVGLNRPQNARSLKFGSFFIHTPTPTPAPTLTPAPTVSPCLANNVDFLAVIDRSGSMKNAEADNRSKLTWALEAVSVFIDAAANSTPASLGRVRLGLVSFSTSASKDVSLTNDFDSAKARLSGISPRGSTCIKCALETANQEFVQNANADPNALKVVILLSDGDFNTGGDPRAVAQAGKTNQNIVYYVVGFGDSVKEDVLADIANDPDIKYYRYRPDVNAWALTFFELFKEICPAA